VAVALSKSKISRVRKRPAANDDIFLCLLAMIHLLTMINADAHDAMEKSSVGIIP
jgi:hypothetical protein